MKKFILLFMIALGAALLLYFLRKGLHSSIDYTADQQDSKIESLLSKQECDSLHIKDIAAFPVGISFGNEQVQPRTQQIITEVDRITTTQFFPSLIWKGEQSFKFEHLDKAVQTAQKNKQLIHGHCLVYAHDTVNPRFLREFKGSNEEFEKLVKQFITLTVSRYRGKIMGYDIANELFEYDNGRVSSNWLSDRFSTNEAYFDFIARCYHYAHAADPEALLFYNDYGQEFSNGNFEKGRAIKEQIKKWLDQGVPIHGYGLQMHTNIYRPVKDIEKALKMAVETGLKIHISELDVSINWANYDVKGIAGGLQGVENVSPELLLKQKQMYAEVAKAYKKIVPPAQQYGITLWDLNDQYSWLKTQRFEAATLFDENCSRKPAFYGFLEGVSGENIPCE